MNKLKALMFFCVLAVVASCVTINVYFPSAEAERAAEKFVGEVLGERNDEGSLFNPLDPPAGIIYMAAVGVVDFFVPSAQAQQPDFKINTPQINSIKSRMAARQKQNLNAWFDSGAIGFTADGLVMVRDRAAIPLSERRNLESVVADENRDRKAVYREIAVANSHPEWEQQIQQTWSQEWIRNARPGWYYQQSNGSWQQK